MITYWQFILLLCIIYVFRVQTRPYVSIYISFTPSVGYFAHEFDYHKVCFENVKIYTMKMFFLLTM